MKHIKDHPGQFTSRSRSQSGFTLIEVLVTLLVTSVLMMAVFMNYVTITRAGTVQRSMSKMQQDMRAAMYLLKNDIRNCGRTKLKTDDAGIQNVSLQDTSGNGILYPQLVLTTFVDRDGDGSVEETAADLQTITYQLMDLDGDGRMELRRQVTGAGAVAPLVPPLVIEGIEDMGIAYAIDANNDHDLDRSAGAAANQVIWAVDSNGDNLLDANLDNNNDGNIDINDDGNADDVIDNADGGLGATVTANNIRAVRIWLLGRSTAQDTRYRNNGPFVVGGRVFRPNAIQANNDQFRRFLLQGAIALNNHEMIP